ncbi:MAG TPA: tRNA (adenosine(37)-N6)-threonylcarbamoyltransferase complex transferase subunit TsaD [Erysipelotrichaceae bacterium]|jgi:N6-L-threonylcarbamoyladenine synthase|nr:tRNA (adenosine(37)-N6)-threonylcarbamoyltransferase complex transferase subunit TsaD [Bacillota bacterium]NLP21236.1 tRNA (adenosine(37)-N6)-threonylcarbamoyltransferase complex transferase subunit TsaD [Erysipelotrichaceae bacterium]HCY07117.1 tRNA (adenosine(37)-N6)-threonylcarbamoyltransferase complex transferase subunit TsaD [Erysipelotrichaceae bacterium]
MSKYILAIETSCDETACAIVKDNNQILSNIVSSQINVHELYGGVVPEVASRIHIENISLVIEEALKEAKITIDDIDAIAVTQGPGLIGSLHVGIQAAKTIAWLYNKPIIPLHHIVGHIYANKFVDELEFPLLALVVSGGHTELIYMEKEYSFEVIGTTQDDAIGEAYDKVARVLGLGYPGGPKIDNLAKTGKENYTLPIPKVENPYDFSFSGLKSAVIQLINRLERRNEEIIKEDVAYSFQESALSQVLKITDKALNDYKPKHLVLAGGVAANSRLRELMQDMILKYPNIKLTIPPLWCCTDNAAMMAVAGSVAYDHKLFGDLYFSAQPSKPIS